MVKLNEKEKAETLELIIGGVWASLESHLPFTHKDGLVHPEDNEFHKKCVVEYAELIVLLTRLY